MSTASVSPELRAPLPPSSRDFLAYERIIIDGFSTRQAAEELKISQTRVRQLVRKVADWLAENLPAHDETRQAAQLRLAQHIAADRLHRYLSEVEHAWQRTRETKYLSPIIRLLTALSKIPAHPHTLFALAPDVLRDDLPASGGREPTEAEPATSTQEPPSQIATQPAPTRPESKGRSPFTTTAASTTDDPHALARSASEGKAVSIPSILSVAPTVSPTPRSELRTPQSPPPPSKACSPQHTTAPTSDAKKAPLQPLTTTLARTSQIRTPQSSTARQSFLAPAHSPAGTGILSSLSDETSGHAAITQLELTPQSIKLSTPKHSSRRDRRRLQRLLTKK